MTESRGRIQVNRASCQACGDAMHSVSILAQETCSCGNLTVSGGGYHLGRRRVKKSIHFEELSAFGLDAPETTFARLQNRANALAGATVGELAILLGAEIPVNFNKDKGFVGNLVQLFFGYQPNPSPTADLGEFQIEVKTFAIQETLTPPLSAERRNVKDNVKLYSFLSRELVKERDWSSSAAYKKLRCLLLVPYVRRYSEWTHTATKDEIGLFYFRLPIVWLPSADQGRQLEEDWTEILSWYKSGDAEGDGSPGTYLFADTAGSRSSIDPYRYHGRGYTPPKRALYLKKDLVSRLVTENCLLSEIS